jgi:hypothetical protein
MMDSVQKNAVTDYNTPSSEPFRLQLQNYFLKVFSQSNAMTKQETLGWSGSVGQ